MSLMGNVSPQVVGNNFVSSARKLFNPFANGSAIALFAVTIIIALGVFLLRKCIPGLQFSATPATPSHQPSVQSQEGGGLGLTNPSDSSLASTASTIHTFPINTISTDPADVPDLISGENHGATHNQQHFHNEGSILSFTKPGTPSQEKIIDSSLKSKESDYSTGSAESEDDQIHSEVVTAPAIPAENESNPLIINENHQNSLRNSNSQDSENQIDISSTGTAVTALDQSFAPTFVSHPTPDTKGSDRSIDPVESEESDHSTASTEAEDEPPSPELELFSDLDPHSSFSVVDPDNHPDGADNVLSEEQITPTSSSTIDVESNPTLIEPTNANTSSSSISTSKRVPRIVPRTRPKSSMAALRDPNQRRGSKFDEKTPNLLDKKREEAAVEPPASQPVRAFVSTGGPPRVNLFGAGGAAAARGGLKKSGYSKSLH